LSDHTDGIDASIMATCLDAKIIEKHFTLNKKMKGPDHFASINPLELKVLVSDIRRTEKILGSYIRKVQPEEMSMRRVSRKSLIYKKNFLPGHIIQNRDLTSIRPGTGILGNKIKFFISKRIKKNVAKGTFLKGSDFER